MPERKAGVLDIKNDHEKKNVALPQRSTSHISHESVLSSGGARAFLAPRPLIPPFELAPLRAGVAPGAFGFGRRMPSAPSISLDPLETSAGGRPGEASSTAVG